MSRSPGLTRLKRKPILADVTPRRVLTAAAWLAVAVVTVTVLGGVRLLAQPEAAARLPPDPGAGLRVEQTVAQLLLRQAGLSRRNEPLVFTEGEINSFLTRRVEAPGAPLWPAAVRVENGWLEVAGRTSLRRLLRPRPLGWLLDIIPDAVLDLGVWLAARGRIDVQDGHGRFVADAAAIGRQPVPREWLWRLLGIGPAELLSWRMPGIVERIDLEPGRLVIHTRPPAR